MKSFKRKASRLMWVKEFLPFLFIVFFNSQVLDAQSLEKWDDDSEIIELLLTGTEKMQNGEYQIARTYFEEGIRQSKKHDSVRLEILCYNNIGAVFHYLNEPDSALQYYYVGLDKAEKGNLLHLQNKINNNIGIVYATTGHHVEALQVLEKAYAISVLLNDTGKMALNLANIGQQNLILKNSITAESNLTRAKEYFILNKDSNGLHSVYVSLGKLNFLNSNYLDALDNFNLALLLFNKNFHSIDLPDLYNNIGQTELALKNYSDAIRYFEMAYNSALQNNQLEEATRSLIGLRDLYAELENLEKAMVYSEMCINLKDSIIQLEKANWIEESKVKYQFELKQKEYDLLQNSAEKRTLFLWIVSTTSLTIVLLLIIILRLRMKTSKLRDEKYQSEKRLNKEKISKVRTRNIELQEKIESINYELVSNTLLLENKNQIINSMGSILDKTEMYTDSDNNDVRQLRQHLLRDSNIEKNWEDFKLYFERVHTDFFQRIHHSYPSLTTGDLRLSAFVLLQFNSKEISQILNISPDSVRKRKQRLREKIGLKKGDDLLNYLYSFTR